MGRTIRGKMRTEAQSNTRAAGSSTEGNARTYSPVWMLPDNTEVTIQFLEDPFDVVSWREVTCSQFKHVFGVWENGPYAGRDRAEIPFGFRDIVVEDWKLVEKNGEQFIRMQRRDGAAFDPVNIAPGEQSRNLITDVLDADSAYFTNEDGFLNPAWYVGINVVVHAWPEKVVDGKKRRTPQQGDHIILKVKGSDWDNRLRPALEDRAAEGDDLLGTLWRITTIKAESKGASRRHKLLRGGAALPFTTDLHDVSAIVDAQREDLLTLARAAFADMSGIVAQEPAVAEPAEQIAQPYGNLSAAALRAKLTAAGVTFPARASRDQLIALANEYSV